MSSILTVITEAASADLTTLDAVKLEMGFTDINEQRDAKLTAHIHQASADVASYCNRVFAQETLSEQFRQVRSCDALVLARRPVVSISGITENSSSLGSADYEFDRESGCLYRLSSDARSCWPCGKIAVAYVAGYELLDGLPFDVERAAILRVKQYWFAATRDPLVKAEDLPNVMRTEYWVGGIGDTDEVARLLAPYRNPVIA